MTDFDSTVAPTGELTHDIVTAVADAEGVEPVDLPPLYDAIDPDALVRVIECDGVVEFTYCGYRVSVHGDQRIRISSKSE